MLYVKNKGKVCGFTLIELLVVIAIIAMLLAILMPALGAVKKKAQDVICRTNLRQWSLSYQLYAENNNGRNAYSSMVSDPDNNINDDNNSYVEVLRDYYQNFNKMRTCPSASKPRTTALSAGTGTFAGATFNAWLIKDVGWMTQDDWGIGSYMENTYIRRVDPAGMAWGGIAKASWEKMGQQGGYDIPLIMDGRWHNMMLIPGGSWVPLVSGDGSCILNVRWDYIDVAVMRRHNKGINIAFLDYSVRNVPVEELWELKWHKLWFDYETERDDPDILALPRQAEGFID